MSPTPTTKSHTKSTDSQNTDAESTHAELARRLLDDLSQVAQPAVSPDGTRIAHVVTTLKVEDNAYHRRVWLDGQPLTQGDNDTNPIWSPCGRYLAFTSRRAEKKSESTLHVIPVDRPGETRTLATRADGLGDLSWSPDGRYIAFTSRVPHERYSADSDADRSPRKLEKPLSRLNDENWIYDRPNHVFVIAADGTGSATDLTPGDIQHYDTAWTPDSKAVITSSSEAPEWGTTNLVSNLYHVPIDGSGPTVITTSEGERSTPAVSPDGTRVAFRGFNNPGLNPQNEMIGVVTLDASRWPIPAKDIVWASAALDRTFLGTNGTTTPIWLDDNTLLSVAEDRGDQHLYRITADGSTAPVALTSGPLVITNTSAVRPDGGEPIIVTTRATATCPPELYRGDERLTRVAAAVEERSLGWEKFEAPTTDGSGTIDAWIMRPADFDADATYPVLLNVHGGPFTQYGESWFDEFQAQAQAGFVVVAGNPRGSSGRDSNWGQAITGPLNPYRSGQGWGSVDVDDVMAIIDTALERYSFCDRDRVGMLGGSYGGFMATELAGRNGDRFRAFCSERAVNNLISMEWNSDLSTLFRSVHGVSHLEDPEFYASRSPIRNVDKINRPMLIIHSEEDWRCPISQAEELWVALNLLGKEVDFYRFPGESHSLSRSGSPKHRVERLEIILDFFTRHLAVEG